MHNLDSAEAAKRSHHHYWPQMVYPSIGKCLHLRTEMIEHVMATRCAKCDSVRDCQEFGDSTAVSFFTTHRVHTQAHVSC